jgi:hypothetical protein
MSLLVRMRGVMPTIHISGSAVPIARICGRREKLEADASAIRRVTVIICRISVGSHVPGIWSAGGIALN